MALSTYANVKRFVNFRCGPKMLVSSSMAVFASNYRDLCKLRIIRHKGVPVPGLPRCWECPSRRALLIVKSIIGRSRLVIEAHGMAMNARFRVKTMVDPINGAPELRCMTCLVPRCKLIRLNDPIVAGRTLTFRDISGYSAN
jgi:hypothetical protein